MLVKKLFVVLLSVAAVLSLAGCHQRVEPVSGMEKQMNCNELKREMSKTEQVKHNIANNRGVCLRNGLGLLFWPSIVINELTGESAETQASQRLVELRNLYASKQCSKYDCAVNANG